MLDGLEYYAKFDYCECDKPAIVLDVDKGCRRCGLPIDFSTPVPGEPERVADGAEGGYNSFEQPEYELT